MVGSLGGTYSFAHGGRHRCRRTARRVVGRAQKNFSGRLEWICGRVPLDNVRAFRAGRGSL